MAVMMNVAGFSDALAAAVKVEVSPGVNIAIASLPGIAILKLFAWADRGQDNQKDAIDLVSLLRGYHEAGNEDRIYVEKAALEALETAGYDIESWPAHGCLETMWQQWLLHRQTQTFKHC
jgi:predicted nucleotidyltransferase